MIVRCLSAALFVCFTCALPALACGGDVLGVARVLPVDARTTPAVGRKHFARTLPLAPKEVVLTFDDGPTPPSTGRVLDALARECVRATFFLLGRNALAHPSLARRIAEEGHTVAYHTFAHPLLNRRAPGAAEAEIARGMAAVDGAAFGQPRAGHENAFFRFPGFAFTRDQVAHLNRKDMVVFGADLWASDWNPMRPQDQLALTLRRLEATRGGIILFHDTKAQTAAMLPAFLRALKQRGYRIVHAVPAAHAPPGH